MKANDNEGEVDELMLMVVMKVMMMMMERGTREGVQPAFLVVVPVVIDEGEGERVPPEPRRLLALSVSLSLCSSQNRHSKETSVQ